MFAEFCCKAHKLYLRLFASSFLPRILVLLLIAEALMALHQASIVMKNLAEKGKILKS